MAEVQKSDRKRRFTEEQPKTSTYTLLEGKKHVHDGVALEPGDQVELTEAQARAFADKFKKSGEEKKPVEGKPPQEVTERLPQRPQDADGQNIDLSQVSNPENKVAITPGKPVPSVTK